MLRDLGRGATGRDRLCVNDGSGTFTDATAARMPPETDMAAAVACGDVDGDIDLVFGAAVSAQNRLYFNLQRQLDAPADLKIGQAFTLDVPLGQGTFALPAASLRPISARCSAAGSWRSSEPRSRTAT